jgi:hypothetical protein
LCGETGKLVAIFFLLHSSKFVKLIWITFIIQNSHAFSHKSKSTWSRAPVLVHVWVCQNEEGLHNFLPGTSTFSTTWKLSKHTLSFGVLPRLNYVCMIDYTNGHW